MYNVTFLLSKNVQYNSCLLVTIAIGTSFVIAYLFGTFFSIQYPGIFDNVSPVVVLDLVALFCNDTAVLVPVLVAVFCSGSA